MNTPPKKPIRVLAALGLAGVLVGVALATPVTAFEYHQTIPGMRVSTSSPAQNPAVAQFLVGGTAVSNSIDLGTVYSRTSGSSYAATTGSATVTVKNNGGANAADLSVGTPSINAPFAIANNTCPATLATGASCSFDINLTPLEGGAQSQPLSLTTTGGTLTATVTATVADAYFGQTALLMHMDNNLSDVMGHTVTNFSPAITFSNTTDKFGSSAYVKAGYGEIMSFPALGTGDFTVEAWVYPTSSPLSTGQYINIAANASGSGPVFGYQNATTWGIANAGGSWIITSTTLPTLNTWSHIAITRKSGTLRIWLNGTLLNTVTGNATQFNADNVWVGIPNVTQSFPGYVDELRYTKGIARYSANFTPPAAAFPNQ